MSLFVCAKCGCVDNTATSSYWMLTNEYMVDKFEYTKELQPYKGMGLCSECGRLKKTAENFGCEYMDVDDFVKKYKS